MSEPKERYANEAEIERVVRGFENCTTPAAEFTHAAHLTVAFSYLHRSRLTVPEAAAQMRDALYRFLDHHQVDRMKYHETITLFWLKLVRSYLAQADAARPAARLANDLIDACADTNIIFDYYSRERLASAEARQNWLGPDLKPLDEKKG